jgi:hypothetical protein
MLALLPLVATSLAGDAEMKQEVQNAMEMYLCERFFCYGMLRQNSLHQRCLVA